VLLNLAFVSWLDVDGHMILLVDKFMFVVAIGIIVTPTFKRELDQEQTVFAIIWYTSN
jgi:hypothetical protein